MKQLVISTKSCKALIESLKGNAKHGYNKLESLKHDGVYYTAILCQNTDASYLERLKIVTGHSVTGDEEDETGTLLYFLSLQPQPITLQLTPEVNEAVEPVQTGAVVTKIKRVPRKPKESK